MLLGLLLLLVAPFWARPAVSNSGHHTLWAVQGRRNTVYLLGSIHVLKPVDYPLPSIIDAVFSNAPVAVFETDLGQMDAPAFQQKLMAKAQLPPGRTLAEQVSPQTLLRFHQELQFEDIAPDMFDHMQASIAALSLEFFQLRKLGFDPAYGIDRHFFRLAQQTQKQILTLEPVDFQIGLVTDFTRQQSEFLMRTTLDELDQTGPVFSNLVRAWQTGDAAQLDELLHKAMRSSPTLFKRMVTDRNQRWASELRPLLAGNKDTIVIVGAGHLVGEQGVVEQLRRDGWAVRQQ